MIANFVTAQVRALSFIAYFKNHQDYLKNNANLYVNGVLDLFKTCPPELVFTIRAIELYVESQHKKVTRYLGA